jgi:hypothetical protein
MATTKTINDFKAMINEEFKESRRNDYYAKSKFYFEEKLRRNSLSPSPTQRASLNKKKNSFKSKQRTVKPQGGLFQLFTDDAKEIVSEGIKCVNTHVNKSNMEIIKESGEALKSLADSLAPITKNKNLISNLNKLMESLNEIGDGGDNPYVEQMESVFDTIRNAVKQDVKTASDSVIDAGKM